MNASNTVAYILPLPVFVIILSLVMMWNPVVLAQLEIPEAKPVDTYEDNGSNSSDTSDYLTFDDPALGYSISYPNDWEAVAPGVEFGLSALQLPMDLLLLLSLFLLKILTLIILKNCLSRLRKTVHKTYLLEIVLLRWGSYLHTLKNHVY